MEDAQRGHEPACPAAEPLQPACHPAVRSCYHASPGPLHGSSWNCPQGSIWSRARGGVGQWGAVWVNSHQFLSSKRNSLGVVAGRRADDTAGQLLRRQLRHLVVCAAQLEGVHLHGKAPTPACIPAALPYMPKAFVSGHSQLCPDSVRRATRCSLWCAAKITRIGPPPAPWPSGLDQGYEVQSPGRCAPMPCPPAAASTPPGSIPYETLR